MPARSRTHSNRQTAAPTAPSNRPRRRDRPPNAPSRGPWRSVWRRSRWASSRSAGRCSPQAAGRRTARPARGIRSRRSAPARRLGRNRDELLRRQLDGHPGGAGGRYRHRRGRRVRHGDLLRQRRAEALARSRAADASNGSPTTDLEGIGDEGYAIEDGTGLSAVHFRRGDLVSYLVVAGNVTPDELRSTATAFDQAMIDAKAGDLPRSPLPARRVPLSKRSRSNRPRCRPKHLSDHRARTSPASPELEGMLPAEIGGTPFIVQSFTGADAFGNDVGSRAVTAGLRRSASPGRSRARRGVRPE